MAAETTSLSYDEVSALLMVSPVQVCEWVQKGMLHARMKNTGDLHFALEDVQQFARDNGQLFSRPGQQPLHLLIIDSDVQYANVLVDLFDTLSESVEVAAVSNAFDAGRELSQFQPDVVLLDMMMPHQDSLEICRRIKNNPETRDVRIIGLTAYEDAERKQRAIMSGAEACLAKPVDHQELFDIMGLQSSVQPD